MNLTNLLIISFRVRENNIVINSVSWIIPRSHMTYYDCDHKNKKGIPFHKPHVPTKQHLFVIKVYIPIGPLESFGLQKGLVTVFSSILDIV